MVTANRLADGVVVYLAADGRWRERCADGHVVDDRASAAQLLATAEAAVATCDVVGPYLIDVVPGDGGPRPQRYREQIRAAGPSIRTDLGKQAEGY
jgi:hypothetical protein